jgi:hypothetical protein
MTTTTVATDWKKFRTFLTHSWRLTVWTMMKSHRKPQATANATLRPPKANAEVNDVVNII